MGFHDETDACGFPPARSVRANGISMSAHEQGEGPAVILLHGFPELAYSWRRQIPALAAAGWRAVAPDLRGYGGTGAQGDVSDYSMRNLGLDVLGLLEALKIDRAVLMGHDFGGALAWALARDHPTRFAGVISLNTPYTRRGAQDLAETMRLHRGSSNYMVQFQTPGLGEHLLERDLEGTFRSLMRRGPPPSEFENMAAEVKALPMTLFSGGHPELRGRPLLTDAELQVYVSAFRRTGFVGPLSWYRNLHQNWLDTEHMPDRVEIPALMISAENDYFLPPATTAGMERYVPDLERALIADCGHWTQQEAPDQVNALVLGWLERRMKPRLS